MPCTITRLFRSRKIAMAAPPLLRRSSEFGGALGGAVHRVVLFDTGQRRGRQNRATVGRTIAIKPDDEGCGDLFARVEQLAESGDDAVRYRVAGGDAAEHVDEN